MSIAYLIFESSLVWVTENEFLLDHVFIRLNHVDCDDRNAEFDNIMYKNRSMWYAYL